MKRALLIAFLLISLVLPCTALSHNVLAQGGAAGGVVGGGDDTPGGALGGSLDAAPSDEAPEAGSSCELDDSLFGIPTWYKYLEGETDPAGNCRLQMDFTVDRLTSLMSIGLAIIEILLFVAGVVAVVFIVVGGFRYVLSQGNPDETAKAKDAVLNAVIGLVIAIIATGMVRFLSTRLVE